MSNYIFTLIIIFESEGSYMFEFGQDEIIKLFSKNPLASGENNIEIGKLFKIKGTLYEVTGLKFSYFIKGGGSIFDSRLRVEIEEVSDESRIAKHSTDIIELNIDHTSH